MSTSLLKYRYDDQEENNDHSTMKFDIDLPSEDSLSADSYVRRYHVVATFVCVVGLGLAIYSMMNVDSTALENAEAPSRAASVSGRIPAVEAFNLHNTLLDREDIHIGNPFKDAIPSLTEPQYVSSQEADFLSPDDEVIGYVEGEKARAYPLRIMNYHEAVNDQIGETPFAITYSLLCKSAVVFDRSSPFGRIQFGVSGLLYNSNVLFYDRATTDQPGLYSQLGNIGISERLRNQSLRMLPLQLTTWKDWLDRYPQTLVLSDKTGYERNYQESPYKDYFNEKKLMFPVNRQDSRYPQKSMVLGVLVGDKTRCYPYQEFANVWKASTITDQIDGKVFQLRWNPEAQSLVVDSADEGVTWVYSFWFAWYAFHQDTAVYQADASTNVKTSTVP